MCGSPPKSCALNPERFWSSWKSRTTPLVCGVGASAVFTLFLSRLSPLWFVFLVFTFLKSAKVSPVTDSPVPPSFQPPSQRLAGLRHSPVARHPSFPQLVQSPQAYTQHLIIQPPRNGKERWADIVHHCLGKKKNSRKPVIAQPTEATRAFGGVSPSHSCSLSTRPKPADQTMCLRSR